MAGATPEPLGCPDDAALAALVAGAESEAGLDPAVEDHLGNCARCRSRLDAIAGEGFLDFTGLEPPVERSEALGQAMATLKTQPISSLPVDLDGWLEPTDDPGLIGVLDRYEVRRVIEEGGMGIVLEAWDPDLEREVAIKLIKPSGAPKLQARDRLLREARAAAGFLHDAVIPIYAVDVLERDELPFIVMPMVRGGSLQDRMDSVRGPLPPDEAVSIGRQVADALDAAHSKGMLHRDIKPANILMRGDGKIWVADFGLARGAQDERLTREGELSGTPQFMAPEQIDGGVVDHRADLFSLGGVLYQMVTGKRAFSGDSGLEIVRSVVDRQHEPAAEANPEAPAWLAELIDRLLEKKPERRPASARSVVRALEEHEFISRQPGSWRGGVVVAAAVIVMGFAIFSVARDRRPVAAPVEVDYTWTLSPFQIPARSLGGESLQGVVASAQEGDEIEIHRDGVVHQGELDLLGKTLTIRAASGSRPLITSSADDTPVISNRAPLCMEGIQFVAAKGSKESLAPYVRAQAPLAIANCTFLRRGDGRAAGSQVALISLDGASQVMLINAAILSADGPAIAIVSGVEQLEMSNCFFIAPQGIYPRHAASERPLIRFERSSFHGRDLVVWMPGVDFSPLDVEANSSVFERRGGIFAMPWRSFDEIEGKVRFSGGENLFSLRGHYLSFGQLNGGKQAPAAIGSLERWQQQWELGENGDAECEMDFIARGAKFLRGGEPEVREIVPSADAARRFPERGVDADFGGLRNFSQFRSSSGYQEWRERVAELFRTGHAS